MAHNLEHAVVRLQSELEALRTQRRTKDLSPATALKEWTGLPGSLPVYEFFNNIDAAARLGNLSDEDKKYILRLKIAGPAFEFLQSRPDLTQDGANFADIRAAFEERFRGKMPDNFYYVELQTATQKEKESPEAFADRVKTLSLKTLKETRDPLERRILAEEAERRLLAAYVAGLRGEIGKYVRLGRPKTMKDAVELAITATNEARQETSHRDVFVVTEHKLSQSYRNEHTTENCSEEKSLSTPRDQQRRDAERNSHYQYTNTNRGAAYGFRRNNIVCYSCRKRGHIARECFRNRYDRPNQGNGDALAPNPVTPRQ